MWQPWIILHTQLIPYNLFLISRHSSFQLFFLHTQYTHMTKKANKFPTIHIRYAWILSFTWIFHINCVCDFFPFPSHFIQNLTRPQTQNNKSMILTWFLQVNFPDYYKHKVETKHGNVKTLTVNTSFLFIKWTRGKNQNFILP